MTPLAVYIHWPFCKSKCPYCDFNSHVRDRVEQERWQAALLKEMEHMAAHTGKRAMGSIFFGGGTPSLMPAGTVAALIDKAHALWSATDDIEITLEANPTSAEAGRFRDFRAAGVNRVSLGVQSLRAEELAFLGRQHNVSEAKKAIDLARGMFPRYSFDLIYARPGQTPAAWEAELTEALALADGHMSLYQLTIETGTAFHHAYAKGGFTLPDEGEAEALYRLTEQVMAAHGLLAYEVSNYAKPGQESRHNLAYWQGRDYVGIGPGAHGRLRAAAGPNARPAGRASLEPCSMELPAGNSGSNHTRIATATLKSPERWLEGVERDGHAVETWQEIDRQQEAEERLMMGLRLRSGIDYREFERQAGYDLRPYLNEARLALYQKQGLLEEDDACLKTTLNGRLVLGSLTAELLA